jgi:hypothetical protein
MFLNEPMAECICKPVKAHPTIRQVTRSNNRAFLCIPAYPANPP